MYNIAARKAWIPEITKLSEVPKDRILPWQWQATQSTPTQSTQSTKTWKSWQTYTW
jgi:hypothetical protein